VYTSADSVFQIAAHENVIPWRGSMTCAGRHETFLPENMRSDGNCKAFHRRVGNYKRTDRRKDFSLAPVGKTLLDYAVEMVTKSRQSERLRIYLAEEVLPSQSTFTTTWMEWTGPLSI